MTAIAATPTTPVARPSGNTAAGDGSGALSPFAQLLAALSGGAESAADVAGAPASTDGTATPQDVLAALSSEFDGLSAEDLETLLEQLDLDPDSLPPIPTEGSAQTELVDALTAWLEGLDAKTGEAANDTITEAAIPSGTTTTADPALANDPLSAVPGSAPAGDADPSGAGTTAPAITRLGTQGDGETPQPLTNGLRPQADATGRGSNTGNAADAALGADADAVLEGDVLTGDAPRRTLTGGAAADQLNAAAAAAIKANTTSGASTTAKDALAAANALLQDPTPRSGTADITSLLHAIDPATQARSADAQAGLQPRYPASTGAAVPMESLAITIFREAQNGNRRFEIQLDPPELGRIDVRLEMTRDGRVQTHLMVERPETLDQLVRDARQLERALSNAGMKLEDASLQFSLKDQGDGGQPGFGWQQRDTPSQPPWQSSDGDPETAEIDAMARVAMPSRDGLDLSI